MKNKLCLVIGHSSNDRGVFSEHLNLWEWEYNRDVAKIAFRYAKENLLECEVFERKGYLPDDQEIKEVYGRVNASCLEFNACCIELHCNSFMDPKTGKTGTVAGSLALFDKDPSDGLAFARTIYEEILPVFNRDPRKKSDCRGFHLAGEDYKRGEKNLIAAKVTACIIEPAFFDNKEDCAKLNKYMIEYAYALVDGAVKFLNYKAKQKEFGEHAGI